MIGEESTQAGDLEEALPVAAIGQKKEPLCCDD